ncbi:hypothetical protein [Xylanimonas protaetiae]|uniref:Uncharacterized protein n=1 Tax=Xylanimonas protaetiae TaxID=2509457 RepID=A0A4P6F836_9MICO|nr:hypothetical protein [Xylanimonas protaetiae]QAY70459.1 hypothetical protein ET471_10820 [Xylanimonas protaetiae]
MFAALPRLALTLLIIAALVGLVVAVPRRPTEPRRDAAWLAGTWLVPTDEVDVYARSLRRVRAHRRAGGWIGIAFAVVAGIAWGGQVTFGIATHGPLADVLFCGVAGVLVGALSAETYRLTLPRAGASASASLAPRPELPGRRQVVAARVLAGASVVVGAATAATGHGTVTLFTALLVVVLVLVCAATRASVAHRRRPALLDRALVVDGNLRAFAARTVAWLELTAGTLAATWAVSALGSLGWLPDVPAAVLSLGTLVTAVVFLVKASPRPPRRFAWSDPAPLAGTVPIA